MKIFLICSIFAVLLFFCADAENSHLTDEDRAIIAAAFNPTNDFRQAGEILYPYNTNMFWTIAKTDPARRREFAYNVMTNALEFRKDDGEILRCQGKSVYPTDTLLMIVCGFNCSTQDLPYIECMADYFGDRFGQTEYVFNPLDELTRHGSRYYTRYDYSRKNEGLFWFGELVVYYEQLLCESAIPLFRSNIIIRAELDERGINRIWNRRRIERIRNYLTR